MDPPLAAMASTTTTMIPPPQSPPSSIEERCEYMYNTSNASTIARLVFPNATLQQFVTLCVSHHTASGRGFSPFLSIPYGVIFLLSVLGNSLVILTLVRHKKMRTITNMYLLNLAVSDLLLAVFCMPFTLVPLMMEQFIFGPVICVMIRYLQAVSVGVSCFTLVVISIERFYAICQPLRSRRWQTLKHSYRVLVLIWVAAFLLMLPIAVFTKLHQLRNGVYACREIWDHYLLESMYAVLLDIMLFAMPLLVMGVSYSLVARELWSATMQMPAASTPTSENGDFRSRVNSREKDAPSTPICPSPMIPRRHDLHEQGQGHRHGSSYSNSASHHGNGSQHQGGAASAMQALRPEYYNRVLTNKRRVIKMLCFIVVEYFICWAPLYTLSTWTVIDYLSAHRHVTQSQKAAILLLAYLSSCIHPITYCFMNKRFRQSFADAFRCCFKESQRFRLHSEGSQGMKLVMSTGKSKSRINGTVR